MYVHWKYWLSVLHQQASCGCVSAATGRMQFTTSLALHKQQNSSPKAAHSMLVAGWDNASFRGYADYMQREAFSKGLHELLQLAEGPDGPVAIMCAEVVSFRCHRSLISDAAAVRGWEVQHITSPNRPPSPHKLTKFAVVGDDGAITYPAYEHTPKKRKSSGSGRSREGAKSSGSGGGRGRKRSQPD